MADCDADSEGEVGDDPEALNGLVVRLKDVSLSLLYLPPGEERKEALRSLLNADMICFHCFTYARHFLSCCSGLLGLEHRPAKCGMISLNFNGHHVGVRACHVGIDAETIVRRLQVREA